MHIVRLVITGALKCFCQVHMKIHEKEAAAKTNKTVNWNTSLTNVEGKGADRTKVKGRKDKNSAAGEKGRKAVAQLSASLFEKTRKKIVQTQIDSSQNDLERPCNDLDFNDNGKEFTGSVNDVANSNAPPSEFLTGV